MRRNRAIYGSAMSGIIALVGYFNCEAADPTESVAQLYLARCAACHGPSLSGGQFGPALKGEPVSGRWRDNREQLFNFIKANMPPSQPGSLNDGEYRLLSEYILAANSAPAPVIVGSVQPAGPDRLSYATRTGHHFGPERAEDSVFGDASARLARKDRKALLDALSPVTDSMLEDPPADDWLHWRGSYGTSSRSPLSEVNRSNVVSLTTVWSWSLPVSVNEIAPLVHDGVMFVNSANQVQALDAASGTILWRYVRNLSAEFLGSMNQMQRSFAIAGSNLYLATADLHVIALDMKNGNLVWDHEVAVPGTPGVMLSSGPLAVHGKIIQGVSGGLACKGGCYIVGLDALTGQQIWRFDTTAKPGTIGGDTWNDTPADDRYGGAVWVTGSYDPNTDLVYFGTGQTYHAYTLLNRRSGRPPKNNLGLFTDSTLALNPATGRLVWYHQHQSHDVWDLDEAFERMLVTLPVNGRQQQLVLTTGKLGIVDALDRATGHYVFSIDLGLQSVVSTIDPKTGSRTVASHNIPEPYKTFEVCPSAEGARNWMSAAYDPESVIVFLPMLDACMDFTWRPNPSGSTPFERADIGWTLRPAPNSDGQYGRVEAVNLLNRQTVWTRRFRAPTASSLLLTSGGLLFSGYRDRFFRALDPANGKTLWETRLNGVPNSSPITYSVDGRQYLAVVAGGGGPHDLDIHELTPEIVDSTASTTLWVFSLPRAY